MVAKNHLLGGPGAVSVFLIDGWLLCMAWLLPGCFFFFFFFLKFFPAHSKGLVSSVVLLVGILAGSAPFLELTR